MRKKRPAPKRRTAKALSDWHPEDVKAAVRKKGKSLSDLARDYEYSESYLRGTLIRPRPYGEEIIAKFLGIPAAEIWPSRYKPRKRPRNGRVGKRKP